MSASSNHTKTKSRHIPSNKTSIPMASLGYTSKMLDNGVHALMGGQGETIICIPGWPQTTDAFLDIFPALSSNHHVLILDPPGIGDSAPSLNGYDTRSIVKHLVASVKAEIGGSTKYHLVGHDVGAWIAFGWAAQEQPSILSLTLMDATLLGLTPTLPLLLPGQANIKLWQFVFNRLPELPEILTQGREREFLDWLFDQKAVYPDRINRSRRDKYVAAYSKPGAMSNGFAYYRDVPQSVQQNKEEFGAQKLNVPVLALGGRHGAGEVMKSIPNSITSMTARSQVVVIEDCGHYVMEEQPEICAKTILDFVRTNANQI